MMAEKLPKDRDSLSFSVFKKIFSGIESAFLEVFLSRKGDRTVEFCKKCNFSSLKLWQVSPSCAYFLYSDTLCGSNVISIALRRSKSLELGFWIVFGISLILQDVRDPYIFGSLKVI